MSFEVPEEFRIKSGHLASDKSAANNGAFLVRLVFRKGAIPFLVIASDGGGWEHVSVSIPALNRCATWEEMCAIKNVFWGPEDAVMQLHPPRSDWVNNHSTCLHLWRPIDQAIPLPPSLMVGFKEMTPEEISNLSVKEKLNHMDKAAAMLLSGTSE